jgi:hypothetical protein
MPHSEITQLQLKQSTNSDNPLKDKSPSPLPKDKVLQEELMEELQAVMPTEELQVEMEELQVETEELQEELQEDLQAQQVDLQDQQEDLQDLFQEELLILVFQISLLLTQVLKQSQNQTMEIQEDSQLEISQQVLIQLYPTLLHLKLLLNKLHQLVVIENQSPLMMLP